MSQDDRLGELEAFAEVARSGNLTTASRSLDVAVSSISRRLSKLEERLRVRLVERSTRSVHLTDAGDAFLPQCLDALTSYTRATEQLRTGDALMRGRIRISLPNSFGRGQVVPVIPAFVSRHPDVTLDLEFSDRFVDLAAEGFDVAIRIGPTARSAETQRPLGTNRRLLCASPDYLSRFGRPTRPAQLARHRCLSFSALTAGNTWTFMRGGLTEIVTIGAHCRANDADAIRTLAVAGQGITIQAEFNATEDIVAGRLVRILEGWRLPTTPIVAQVASARFIPRRVDAFIDHLRKSLPRYLRN
jgi:DNA-binding transcriptional LysR family regulator